jgi:hypothetical protein
MRFVLSTLAAWILLVASFNAPSAAQPGVTIHLLLQTKTTVTG